MALSFLVPSRTVLIIGDESLCAYSVTSTAVTYLDTVTWDTPDFENRVARLIANDGKGRGVLFVNDTTDQHFKGGQRIPKVGLMDRRNVLNRKLQVAFPNYPIRSALELKASKPQGERDDEAQPAAGSLFIFAGIPFSENINRTVTAGRRSLASVAGFILLPVDSSDMVAKLSAKISGAATQTSQWVVFIGQHRNGGLRQIVIRNGQLAMTRMTPMAETSYVAGEWAPAVNQEIRATVSYLSRFGYTADDGMDILVIADAEAGEDLKSQIDIPCNFVSFTVKEAAGLLELPVGTDQDQYADALHAAWLARKRTFLMPIKVPQLDGISQIRKYATVATVLLALVALYAAYLSISQFSAMRDEANEADTQNTLLITAQKQEDAAAARLKAIGLDVRKIEAAAESYAKFQKHDIDALPVIDKIGQALGGELRLETLKLESVVGDQPVDPAASAPAVATAGDSTFLATLTMSFPSSLDPNVGVQQVAQFSDRLKKVFPAPGYTVQIMRQVADLAYTSATSGKTGQIASTQDAKKDYSAEIQIKEAAR